MQECKSVTIRVEYDEHAEHPRQEFGLYTLGVFCQPGRDRSRYLFGDEGAEMPELDSIPDEAIVSWAIGNLSRADLREIAEYRREWGGSKSDCVRDWIDEAYGGDIWEAPGLLDELAEHVAILPVYANIHSGVRLSTGGFSCPWDSGQVGFIWADEARARKGGIEGDDWRKRTEEVLRAEIEDLDDWHAYGAKGFIIEEDEEPVDSCWGFRGADIDASGMLDYIPDELHGAARLAWDEPEREFRAADAE